MIFLTCSEVSILSDHSLLRLQLVTFGPLRITPELIRSLIFRALHPVREDFHF